MEQVCHCPLHFLETTAGQNADWKFGFIPYISVVFLCLDLGLGWGVVSFRGKKMDCLFFLVSAYQLLITVLQLLIMMPLTY